MKIRASRVFFESHFVNDQEIELDGPKIKHIRPAQNHTAYDFIVSDSHYLIPGMIDLHLHGSNGADVMDATPAALQTISHTLLREGVTGFLATTMTESSNRIEAALSNVVNYRAHHDIHTGAEVLGIHLEGPFLSPQFMGAQASEHLLAPQADLLAKWQDLTQGLIKVITLAPELPGAAELIHKAKQLGIIAAIGHSAATAAETKHAADHGITYATHLFNAMSGVHHRTPGAATQILQDPRITAELIIDGHHLDAAIAQLAMHCKGLDHLVLVSDATRAKCMPTGEYNLGGQAVILEHGAVRLKKNGVLAGSVLKLNEALKNAHHTLKKPLEELLPLVTSTPAKLLNEAHRLGKIAPDFTANLAVLGPNFEVTHTWRDGKLVFQA